MIETEGRSQCKLMDAGQIGYEKHDRTSHIGWCGFCYIPKERLIHGEKDQASAVPG